MKLADDEQIVAEYFFKGTNDVANMSTLTSRRLIVVYGNAEESYPLSKITAVRIIFGRIGWMLAIGALVALVGLSGFQSNNVVGGLEALAIGGALLYFGWKGRTKLEIVQMGGHKLYSVRGRDPKLAEFMDALNGRIS